MKKIFVFTFCLGFSLLIKAQSYIDFNAGLLDMESGSVDWGDYDNDGDLDVLISGELDFARYKCIVYRNDSNSFIAISASLDSIRGYASWGDFDKDGDLDILISGVHNYNEPVTKIYKNVGSDTFSDMDLNLTQISGKSLWGDFDNDNDLDILIAGISGVYPDVQTEVKIYKNDNGTFSEIDLNIKKQFGDIAVGDYNNDNYLDFAIAGSKQLNGEIDSTRIYRNEGNFVFTSINANIPPLINTQSLDWGDFDNDGDLDLLIAGQLNNAQLEKICRLYTNNGNNAFSEKTLNVSPLGYSIVKWCDFDNDGDLDFLYSGEKSNFNYNTSLYLNNNGEFSEKELNIPVGGAIDFADFDKDNDLDILILGRRENLIRTTRIYQYGSYSSISNIEFNNSTFQIYPNPVKNILHCSYDKSDIKKLELYNSCGILMQRIEFIESKNTEVNMEEYNPGLYILKLYTKEKSLLEKFVKK